MEFPERAARRRARHDPAAVACAAPQRRGHARVFGAARLGTAPRVAAGASGRGRARGSRAAARVDALPVRQVHRQRRDADARRAARLQRRPAGAHPREDPRAGFLRAAGDEHAGEDRVRHRAGHADARGALRMAAGLGHAGLTLATSIGACFNAGLLLWFLRRKGYYQPQPGWPGFSPGYARRSSLLAAVIALAMGAGATWLTRRRHVQGRPARAGDRRAARSFTSARCTRSDSGWRDSTGAKRSYLPTSPVDDADM